MGGPALSATPAEVPMEWNTTSTILSKLADFDDDGAWGRLVERFRPVIVGHARNLGFQPADAEDIAQTALMRFAAAYRDGGYDQAKGTLRNWMFTITNRVIVDAFRARARRRTAEGGGEDAGRMLTVEDDRARRDFSEAWDREMLARCLGKARMEFSWTSWQAFVELALNGRPGAEIARELGMTRRGVYLAKYRVLKRLLDLRREFEEPDA